MSGGPNDCGRVATRPTSASLGRASSRLGLGSRVSIPGGRARCCRTSVILPADDLVEPDDGCVLVWSDFHLGDWMGLGSFGRSFDSVSEMDGELLGAWRREVGEDDTVLVLGDVSSGWRSFPGGGFLVFGKHDQNGRAGVVTDPFDDAHLALAVAGAPPLVLTHMPLIRQFPRARVNLYEHIHQHRLPGWRINVSVEQLEWRSPSASASSSPPFDCGADGRTTGLSRRPPGRSPPRALHPARKLPRCRASGADSPGSCPIPPRRAPASAKAPGCRNSLRISSWRRRRPGQLGPRGRLGLGQHREDLMEFP